MTLVGGWAATSPGSDCVGVAEAVGPARGSVCPFRDGDGPRRLYHGRMRTPLTQQVRTQHLGSLPVGRSASLPRYQLRTEAPPTVSIGE